MDYLGNTEKIKIKFSFKERFIILFKGKFIIEDKKNIKNWCSAMLNFTTSIMFQMEDENNKKDK